MFSLVDTEEPFCVQALNYCLRRFAADPHSWNPMWIRRNPSVVLVPANEETKLGDDIEGTMVQDNRVAVGADAGHFVSISGWWIRWWTKWTSQASRRQKFWQDRCARDNGRIGRPCTTQSAHAHQVQLLLLDVVQICHIHRNQARPPQQP